MRVLFLGTQFEPEITALAPFNTDLCKYLVGRGHDVTAVVGFPSYPHWKVHAEYRGRWYADEDHDGVRVLRVKQYVPSRPSTLRRIMFDTTYSVAALLASVRLRRPDVIVATSSPLQIGLTAAALGALWRRPFVFHIQDLLPESGVEVGMLKNRRAISLAHRMADLVYKRAAVISAIGHGFLDAIRRRGVSPDKLTYLPNWVSVDRFRSADGSAWRDRHGISQDALVAMYIGNFGYKRDMGTVVRAADSLREDSRIRFVLVGEGSDHARVAALTEELEPGNVSLLGVQPANELAHMADAADIFLLHQARDVVEMVVPSKLLTYGASGAPIVLAGNPDSEGARFVREASCGVVVRPEEPEVLAEAVKVLLTEPSERARLGANGRAFVRTHFDRSSVLARFEGVLMTAVERCRRAGPVPPNSESGRQR